MPTATPPTRREGAATALDVRPVAGNIGAEIVGVDLAQDLSDRTVADIRAALLDWKVVFFRNQDITQAQHVAFGARFGEVTPAHPTLPAAYPDHPEILLLESTGSEQPGSNVVNAWHTDVSFAINPPMGAILRSVVVPAYGGDTQFTNLALAYETLSRPIRDLIDGLWAVHHNRPPVEDLDEAQGFAERFTTKDIRSRHPVVRVHPETGERVLFVNPLWTSHISGLSRKENAALLGLLYEHLASPPCTVRFRWEPNSIAFWDNRSTCHLIPRDLPIGSVRSMQRITLAGDVPVGVDGARSTAIAGDQFDSA